MTAPRRSGSHTFLGRRTLFRVGGFALPTYSAALYMGCVLGLWTGAAMASSRRLAADRFVIATIVLLVPAFAGARALYVARRWQTYRKAPRRILAVREGGAALYGGLAVAVPLSVVVLPKADLEFWSYWDAASLTMLVGLTVTRLGCLANGCCGGRPSAGRMGLWLPNTRGEWARRVPTQLIEAAFALVIAAMVLASAPIVGGDGRLFVFVVASYSSVRLWLQTLRERAPRSA